MEGCNLNAEQVRETLRRIEEKIKIVAEKRKGERDSEEVENGNVKNGDMDGGEDTARQDVVDKKSQLEDLKNGGQILTGMQRNISEEIY